MTFPRVAFVSSPDLGADVRFDFNTAGEWADGENWPEQDGFSLGVPSLSGDYDAIGVEYGPRELTFNLVIKARKATATATMSALARELLRQRNWLLFQLSPFSRPVWFRTYRTEPGAISFEYLNDTDDSRGNLWGLGVSVDADSFAYGERVILDTVTIANDPAAGTNPCRYILPEIAGDSAAPLRFEVSPSDRLDGWRWMMSVHASAAAVTPIVWQIGLSDGWPSTGIDTDTGVSNAAYSNGSYRTVSFATNANLNRRIYGSAPTSVPDGRYKALLRLARSDTSSTFQLQFGQKNGSAYVYGSLATMDPGGASLDPGHATWVDLGDFTFPFGGAPVGLGGTPAVPDVALQVGRLSGTGSARLDVLMLVPIEVADTYQARTLFTEISVIGDGPGLNVWDGDAEAAWKLTTTGVSAQMPTAEMMGEFPQVVPGEANVLTLLRKVSDRRPENVTSYVGGDLITATTDITLSYQPRWLYMAAS